MKRTHEAPLSIVIADDQATIRDGLMAILSTIEDLEVVGMAQDGAGAVALAERYNADVVLMDLRMSGTGGVEATRALGVSNPHTAVVILTTYQDDELVADAIKAGAVTCLTKDASSSDIELAVHVAVNGRRTHGRVVR
jgi:DNA-binding NarL/FixJ family response regulator